MRIRSATRAARRGVLAAVALSALLLPASVQARSEQVVIEVFEQIPLEFDDPCTGILLSGLAVETGTLRITDLGDRGSHLRLNVRGVADLADGDGVYVGTWSYRLGVQDQIPPGGQGTFSPSPPNPPARTTPTTCVLRIGTGAASVDASAERPGNPAARKQHSREPRALPTCSFGPRIRDRGE